MIKSSNISTKFANTNKKQNIELFINEYSNVVKQFVDIFWELDKIPIFITKDQIYQINSWLSYNAKACAGKQASGIVRGTRQKQEKRLWMINKLQKEGKYKQAKKLENITNKINLTKPNIGIVNPELTSKFIKVDLNTKTSFDGFIRISAFGNKQQIKIPIKRTKHFNKLYEQGNLTKGIRLSKEFITFMFEIEQPIKKETGEILGIDIGYQNVISCSNGFQSSKNKHGHDLTTINQRLCKKQKGSKSFQRTRQHRKDYINWAIKQLNLNNIKTIKLENIKNLRKNIKSSRLLSHWTYTDIFEKLDSICFDAGVQIEKINPTYTSQRCSVCGWTRKANRKGKQFKCTSCGFMRDSDLNASINISFNLKPLGKKERQQQINRKGFFWLAVGQETMIPDVQKVNFTIIYSK